MSLLTSLEGAQPSVLTGYTRAALDDLERAKGSLAQWLPNRQIDGVTAFFDVGAKGMVEEANFRAFDAEPEIGRGGRIERKSVTLAAVSNQNIVSEEDMALFRRGFGGQTLVQRMQEMAVDNATAISLAVERQRAIVLATGKTKIMYKGQEQVDDFGRDPELTGTVAKKWNTDDAEVVKDIDFWVDKISQKSGVTPGTLLVSKKVWRAIVNALSKAYVPGKAGTVPTAQQLPLPNQMVQGILDNYGLPTVTVYDRRTASGPLLDENTVLFLPPAGTGILGATFWGLTEAASRPEFGIQSAEQPGIVTAVFQAEEVGSKTKVQSDAMALPVLANPNACAAVSVL